MITREIPVFLEGPCGPLEALYYEPTEPLGLALICHPHPLFAGSMQNKVVATLQRAAREMGYATLRFNFRGVGQSAGSYGEAQGELEDALAAAHWLLAKHPDLPLTLLGFSFGACIAGNLSASLAAAGIALRQLFMLAPPVQRFPVHPAQDCPLIIIQPAADEVVEPAEVYAWSAALAQPHELLRVAQSSHFFHGQLIELRDLLQARLAPVERPR